MSTVMESRLGERNKTARACGEYPTQKLSNALTRLLKSSIIKLFLYDGDYTYKEAYLVPYIHIDGCGYPVGTSYLK